ncbi:early nodulin-16-like [Lotus japonicus]|uniref:early nodulin-16-like n=1 Tax=Lotus japonicus TaxID=34305 RepID=UPI0025859006|nr:early nodulin-16-like [Lotus japonicus]
MGSLTRGFSMFMIMFSMWLLLLSFSQALEFVVGGNDNSWKVPVRSQDSLSQWAQSNRFSIGDSLIFTYDNETESVHVVNEEDYLKCKVEGEDHEVYLEGYNKVVFNRSGSHLFISGKDDHCKMGLKLAVVVMSHRHHTEILSSNSDPSSLSPSPSPAPSSSSSPTPSPSPASNGVASISGSGFIMWMGVALVMLFFL